MFLSVEMAQKVSSAIVYHFKTIKSKQEKGPNKRFKEKYC